MKPKSPWRAHLHEVIFEADTAAGKWFDLVLILLIILSVVAVLLESVRSVRVHHGFALLVVEWAFTVVFSIEYVLRLICVRRPVRYARSFFGVVDLLAVLPTYLDVLLPGARFLLVVRILRLLRIFRVLKLAQYVGEANTLMHALRASSRKILVFLFAVATIVVIMGAAMYVVEGERNGFTSIPKGVYWAVVTLTTVGYGDVSPKTNLGQTIAAFIMVLGYSILAVPTGIVSAEMTHSKSITVQACPSCSREGHALDARYCKHCGESLSWEN